MVTRPPPMTPAAGERSARTFEEYLSRSHLSELDGIRAVAVILVIAFHVKGDYFKPISGHLGVLYFFVLSGFLITTLALREERKNGSLSIGAFYVRRTFRIFPLYYLTLLAYVLVSVFMPGRAEYGEILKEHWFGYVFYCQEFTREWTDGRMPFVQSWTLGIEEKFYLFLPLICFYCLRGTLKNWRGALLVGGIFGFVVVPLGLRHSDYSGLGRCLEPYASLLMGCLLAVVLDSPRGYAISKRLYPRWLPLTMTAAIVVGQFAAYPAQSTSLEFGFTKAFAVVITLWYGTMMVRDGWVQWFLSRGPMMFLGRMSYGMYLTHLFALYPVHRVMAKLPTAPAAWCTLVVGVAVSALGAFVLSITIEQPMIRIGRKLSARILGTRRFAGRQAKPSAEIVR